jgi:hypothetical protein
MENEDKMKLLKWIRDFLPLLIMILGTTFIKVIMIRANRKGITPRQMTAIAMMSIMTGTLFGLICHSAGIPNWITYMISSVTTLLSEDIIAVIMANGKNTLSVLWTATVDTLKSRIEGFKKKKK